MQEVISKAKEVVRHWNEFGPEYGLERVVDQLAKAIDNAEDSPTLKADAALIAAAPDLLEALEGLLAGYAIGHRSFFAIEKAERAIAKAKGNE